MRWLIEFIENNFWVYVCIIFVCLAVVTAIESSDVAYLVEAYTAGGMFALPLLLMFLCMIFPNCKGRKNNEA